MDRKKLLRIGQQILCIGVCLLVLHLVFFILAYVEISPAPDPVGGKIMFMSRKGLHGFVMPWLGQAVDWTLLGACLTAIPGLLLVGITRQKKIKR
jgi:hypothetical protein